MDPDVIELGLWMFLPIRSRKVFGISLRVARGIEKRAEKCEDVGELAREASYLCLNADVKLSSIHKLRQCSERPLARSWTSRGFRCPDGPG
jgi:hypothetical protein